MRKAIALGLILLLAGCTAGPSLQSRLAAYIGVPESTLVQHFGVPVRQISVDGVDYLAYQVRYQAQTMPGPYWGGPYWGGPYWGGPYWGGPFWGPGWGPYGGFPQDVRVWSCEATFALVKGKVENVSLRGNDCR
ncbi:hypothetical protein [Acidocella sp.]|uniref:hypothetical protein n=1 Tax=Acidocella sp. TaxID=50710 RepID=UPI003D07DE8C